MNQKMLFIYNPFSGKAQIKNHLSSIIDAFVKGGYDVTVRPTQKPLDALETVREKAPAYDTLVVCGGDGTLNESVKGLLSLPPAQRTPLGYIPAGCTNDYAATLHIPKNMSKAAMNILEGHPFLCDAGRFNDNNFVYIAAFGAFTQVSYDTPQKFKNIFGHAAYLLEGIKRLPGIRSTHLRVNSGQMQIEGDFILGMVSNTRSVGGFKSKGQLDAKLNDGLFEVILVKNPNNAIELQNIISDFMRRNPSSPYCTIFKSASVTFESDEPVGWTLDGENGGLHKTVTIQNLNKAFTIITRDQPSLFD